MTQSYALAPVPYQQYFDANGSPLAGGLITTFLAGTAQKKAVFKDNLGTEHENPLTLDSAGRVTIYLGAFAYRFEVTDSLLVSVRTQDNIYDAHLVDAQTFLSSIKTSATLNFPSTAAQTSNDLTVVVTGAKLNDYVLVSVPVGSILTDSDYWGWVSADDQVTVRFSNHSAAARDPASGTFRISVIPQ